MQPQLPGHGANDESAETVALLKEAVGGILAMAEQQLKILRLEAGQQLEQQRRLVVRLGVASLLALSAVEMLLSSAALALGERLHGHPWAGALIIAAPLLILAAVVGAIGWRGRVRDYLPITTAEAEKELEWARKHLA